MLRSQKSLKAFTSFVIFLRVSRMTSLSFVRWTSIILFIIITVLGLNVGHFCGLFGRLKENAFNNHLKTFFEKVPQGLSLRKSIKFFEFELVIDFDITFD